MISIDLDKLDLYGVDYIFEKALSILNAEVDMKRYRAYITDSLKSLIEIIVKMAGGNDVEYPRYYDMIEQSEETPAEREKAEKDLERQKEETLQYMQRQCELIALQKQQKRSET